MVRTGLNTEREAEMSAVWGREKFQDGSRAPLRRRRKKVFGASDDHSGEDALRRMDSDDGDDDDGDEPQEKEKGEESDMSDLLTDDEGKRKKIGEKAKSARLRAKKEKHRLHYRLHCTVAPGTGKNEVRQAFEHYEPTVSLRTAQKGNLLQKTHFAVLTFANKALALHCVLKMDGSNQHDTIGVRSLKLQVMLTRRQAKSVKARAAKKRRCVKK